MKMDDGIGMKCVMFEWGTNSVKYVLKIPISYFLFLVWAELLSTYTSYLLPLYISSLPVVGSELE